MVTRLLWALQQPTPYNCYLLNELSTRLDLPSEAVYRWSSIASHPWATLPPRRFQWRVAERPGERDGRLERRCAQEVDTLVIFSGWRDATIRPALLARWRHTLPYAFWSDTPKIGRSPLRRMLNRTFVFFARAAVTTLATGSPAIARYRSMGVPRGRLDDFPFVVDPAHFRDAVARRATCGDDTIRFVLPARLIDRIKGQSVAVEALSRARAASGGRKLELILAGVGPDESELQKRARKLGVADAVRFVGWVEYADIPELFAAADALVLPSRWDPFPVAVLEAMASGLPVLGSDACGSVRERVRHGENGFVHHAGDVAALAEHMGALAADPDMRARMGKVALRTSNARGIDHCVDVLRGVLARCSGRSRPPA
jgi:glycosyltransferase involved in cell wall biosynthesis